jgi:hypothetical protein
MQPLSHLRRSKGHLDGVSEYADTQACPYVKSSTGKFGLLTFFEWMKCLYSCTCKSLILQQTISTICKREYELIEVPM